MSTDATVDGGRRSLLRDHSLPAVTAGAVAVLVSCTGPLLIVLAAARDAGLTTDQTTSWLWALLVGSGVTCLGLSWWTRQPVITAWSTPGAALLLVTLGDHRFSDAVGAFLVAGVVAAVLSFTGLFGRLLRAVPRQLLSGMLAGVLLPFVLQGALAVGAAPLVAGGVVVAFLAARRLAPRYAVVAGLVVGVGVVLLTDGVPQASVGLAVAVPHLTVPTFAPGALVGIALPLLVVTMASQNAPGLTVLRTDGYEPDERLLVGGTAVVWTALAPWGAHGINLAAITAAICTGPEAHPDPRRRYVAGVWAGFLYLAVAVASTGVVGLFAAVPQPLVAAVAGVALVGALVAALTDALAPGPEAAGPGAAGRSAGTREAAVLTFAVTASGVTVGSVGSPFWGLVVGVVVHLVLTRAGRR